jgi:formate dehydrogenase major subunit
VESVAAELQPELFIELFPSCREKGIKNLDWVRITSAAQSRARQGARHAPPAAVHDRRQDRPPGRHAVALGLRGRRHGDVVNELTALVGDPNVTIHEGKAFVCNVEKG